MMQARDVMVRGVISVGPDIPVQIAANAMVRNCVSALPVIDIHVKLVGIVSEGDLIRRVEIGTERRRPLMSSDAQAKEFVKSHAKRVSDVMTREVITAQPETPLREIVNLMEKHSIKRVPIVRNGKIVGVVSRSNLIQALASAKPLLEAKKESDRAIRLKMLDRLSKQKWTDFGSRNIIVENGVVHLWGLVGSESERKALTALAEDIPGVSSVADEMIPAY